MIRLFSPSKINLFFRVLRKREDGYHEVATLLQAISLGDQLTFEESGSDEDRLETNDPQLPTDSTNLILKASQLFRRKSAIPLYIRSTLDKQVPTQAGLGGGSGNAATTLWAMNELAGRPATPMQLAEWAAEIGSDISFFFSHGIAYCTGRGEKISPCSPLKSVRLNSGWVAKPAAGLSTPMVYRHVNAAALPERDPYRALQLFTQGEMEPYCPRPEIAVLSASKSRDSTIADGLICNDPSAIVESRELSRSSKPQFPAAGSMFNDLEPAAFQAMPALAELKGVLLKAGFTEVLLAGSGSAFVCLGERAVPVELPDVKWYPFRFMTRSEGEWYRNEKDS